MNEELVFSFPADAGINAWAKTLNARHREFWLAEKQDLERRMQDKALVKQAAKRIEAEQMEGVPTGAQRLFEREIEWAEEFKREIVSEQARCGGKAKKADPLQRCVNGIVARNPGLGLRALIALLKQQCPGPVVAEIDEAENEIVLTGAGFRTVTFSGLKSRLTRARRLLQSPKAASATPAEGSEASIVMPPVPAPPLADASADFVDPLKIPSVEATADAI